MAVSGTRLLVFGGHAQTGTTDAIVELTPHLVRTVTGVSRSVRAKTSTNARNVYAADAAGHLTGAARHAVSRIYVPNSMSNTVDEINPTTMKSSLTSRSAACRNT